MVEFVNFSDLHFLIFDTGLILLALSSSKGCFRDHYRIGLWNALWMLKCYTKPRKDSVCASIVQSREYTVVSICKHTKLILSVAAGWASWEVRSEMKIAGKRFTREWSWDPYLGRKERIGLREELSWGPSHGASANTLGALKLSWSFRVALVVWWAVCQSVIGCGLYWEVGMNFNKLPVRI